MPSSCMQDPKDSLDRADENLVTLKGLEGVKQCRGASQKWVFGILMLVPWWLS